MQTPPPGAEQTRVEQLLRAVLRSGLLDRHQLQYALRSLPSGQRDSPEAVAEHLVKTGQLSRFQAGKLLQGTARGLVLGPFQILAPIGKGGMGTVYLARDRRSGQLMALKVLPPRRARESERLLARFRREMELCQRVAHPHLVYTYEVGKHRDVYYIAMEYIPGRSLSRVVKDGGPLPVARAARLFAEVASALDHAHVQGLIHRDLKPGNILVTPNGHAKLLDLGLAIMQGESRTEREVVGGRGYIVGTMDFIAPEQAEDSSRVDPRSDVYALGCSLYFALAGRPPFPGGTLLEKIQRHRTEEPAPVEQLNPEVPAGLGAVVRKMMARRPEDRYPSAAAVETELLRWAGEAELPLDRPGDTAFTQAVMRLEAEAAPEELQAEEIPVSEEAAAEPDGPAALPVLFVALVLIGLVGAAACWVLG